MQLEVESMEGVMVRFLVLAFLLRRNVENDEDSRVNEAKILVESTMEWSSHLHPLDFSPPSLFTLTFKLSPPMLLSLFIFLFSLKMRISETVFSPFLSQLKVIKKLGYTTKFGLGLV